MSDEHNMKYLLLSNCALILVFVAQKIIESIINNAKKHRQQKDESIDSMQGEIVDLKIEMAKLSTQLEMVLKNLYLVQKLEKDLDALFHKFRNQKL